MQHSCTGLPALHGQHLPFLFTFVDDHIIGSRTLEEHFDHLGFFAKIRGVSSTLHIINFAVRFSKAAMGGGHNIF
jgi:hypothetical protein